MADYAAQSDLEDRIGSDALARLADHDGDGVADSTVVQRAIDDAEALVNSYLEARYAVPLSTVPDVVTSCVCDLAIYDLKGNRDSVTDDARERHDRWMQWLKDVAAGRASLGVSEDLPESGSTGGVRHESDDQRFGRDYPL